MKRLIFLFVCSLLSSSILMATEKSKPEEKEEAQKPLSHYVVVTATRTEQSVQKVASSSTVIGKAELEQSTLPTLSDILSRVTGLDISQSGGVGKPSTVFIRGANSQHTLFLVDGVEVNDPISPTRTYDIAHITNDNIERIEVIRGPQSTLYGSDAIGGVVQIFTKKGYGKPRLSLSLEGGSFETYRESMALSGGNRKFDYSFTLSRGDSSGFSASHEKYGNSEKDGYGNTTFSGRIGTNPLKNLNISAMFRYMDAGSDLDNGPGEGGDDPNYTLQSRQMVWSVQASYSMLNDRWNQVLKLSSNRMKRESENLTDEVHPDDSSDALYQGEILKLDWQHDLVVSGTQTVTAGLDIETESGESEYYYQSAWGPGESIFPRQSSTSFGLYLQDNIHLDDVFHMTLGIRSDSHDLFGSVMTYRLAPSFNIGNGTRLRATYGTGFKAPTVYQLYAPATPWGPVGNSGLDPERSTGWDVGLEQYLMGNRLLLGITYFMNGFSDMIEYDMTKGYVNIAEAETKGIELYVSFQDFNGFLVKGSYTRTKTENLQTGDQLLRRPEHKGNIIVSYRFFHRLTAGCSLYYVGERADVYPYPERVVADPYTLLNGVISFELSEKIQVYVRFDNLLDQEYESVIGYGTPGRSIYAGFKAGI